MNELIKVTERTISGDTIQTVNARDLHAFLEVGKVFAAWIQERIEQYGFVEHHDFVVFSDSGNNPKGGRPAKEYAIGLDMAKELAMVERNEQGKQARLYFIKCERRAKSSAIDFNTALSDPSKLRTVLLSYTEKVIALENKVAEQAPKVAALDRISASGDSLTLTEASKVLGVKRNDLTVRLHAEGWIYRQNGSWVGYDKHIKNGNLQYKEYNYTDEKTGLACIKPYCHITQKGLTKLAERLTAVDF